MLEGVGVGEGPVSPGSLFSQEIHKPSPPGVPLREADGASLQCETKGRFNSSAAYSRGTYPSISKGSRAFTFSHFDVLNGAPPQILRRSRSRTKHAGRPGCSGEREAQ